MLVQMSFIKGGVVLCINMQHNVCDILGQAAAVMQWLSKVCCREELGEDDLRVGNVKGRGLIPLIEEAGWSPGKGLDDQLLPSGPLPTCEDGQESKANTCSDSPAPPKCTWSYFNFSASSLKALKRRATSEVPDDPISYISTDDALSAFIFQSILCARQPCLPPSLSATLAYAVDARRYLSISPCILAFCRA
jgi:hypothetical protein